MNRSRKTLLSILVVSLVGGLVAFGTYAAFFSQTSSSNNSFATGSVIIGDNNSGAALYSVSGATPGTASTAKCIKVTYTGSLPASVKLERSAFTGGTGLDTEVDLAVTKGTGAQTNCSDFTIAGSGSSAFGAKLSTLGTSFSGGTALTNAAGSTTWSTNDAVTYKVVASIPSDASDNSRQNKTTGTHTLTWEAQNN